MQGSEATEVRQSLPQWALAQGSRPAGASKAGGPSGASLAGTSSTPAPAPGADPGVGSTCGALRLPRWRRGGGSSGALANSGGPGTGPSARSVAQAVSDASKKRVHSAIGGSKDIVERVCGLGGKEPPPLPKATAPSTGTSLALGTLPTPESSTCVPSQGGYGNSDAILKANEFAEAGKGPALFQVCAHRQPTVSHSCH